MGRQLADSPLGKESTYATQYCPDLLFPLERAPKRAELGIGEPLPFSGSDLWSAPELSWLTENGRPQVMIGLFTLPADSPCIIESKSLKLYLNSFNQSRFGSATAVQERLQQDLAAAAGAPVTVRLVPLSEWLGQSQQLPPGECIDHQQISVDTYTLKPGLLRADPNLRISETLYSDLLKSDCPVTGQPDWGTIVIEYRGARIDRAGLLRYVCSFRQHQEFHEQCVERIFMDIKRQCQPDRLTVYARYLRRGGLDINPWRTDCGRRAQNIRFVRQ